MLYPKLRSIKNYKEEIKYWEKQISKAKRAGMKNQNKLAQLQQNLIETENEYNALKADILKDSKYNSMDAELKKACDEYYFNGKTDMEIDFPGENFHRVVRNHCHKL